MTLAKAIANLEEEAEFEQEEGNHDMVASIRLGIEALKAIKERQGRFPGLPHLRLPSETEK